MNLEKGVCLKGLKSKNTTITTYFFHMQLSPVFPEVLWKGDFDQNIYTWATDCTNQKFLNEIWGLVYKTFFKEYGLKVYLRAFISTTSLTMLTL